MFSSLCFEHLLYLFARIQKAPRLGLPEFWARVLTMNWTLKLWLLPLLNQTWILFDWYFEKSGIFNLKAMGYLQKQCTVKGKILLRPGWVWILGWSYWGIHLWRNPFFDLLTFLQGRIQKFKIFIGWVEHFSENPLSMCRIPWHSTYLSHSLFEQPLMYNCEFTIL